MYIFYIHEKVFIYPSFSYVRDNLTYGGAETVLVSHPDPVTERNLRRRELLKVTLEEFMPGYEDQEVLLEELELEEMHDLFDEWCASESEYMNGS